MATYKLVSIIFILIFCISPRLGFSESERINYLEIENGLKSECDSLKFESIIEGVKRGDVHSIFQHGQLYYLGVCVEENLEQSFFFFAKAAKEGHIAAFYNVALMYHLGLGVERDVKKATSMFEDLLGSNHKPTENYVCNLSEEYGLDMEEWIDQYSILCGPIELD